MIEIIGGVWAAGETKTFHVNGEYIELLDGLYACDVFLMDKSGAQLSIMRGCEVSFFSKPSGGFNTVQITSVQAQYLRFFVGSGDAGTRRISSTVQVVDGGRARSIAGQAFMGVATTGPIAAASGCSQLWNPVGSGKNAVVKRYSVCGSTAGFIQVRTQNSIVVSSQVGTGFAKQPSLAPGVVQVRAGNPAGSVVGNMVDQMSIMANGVYGTVLQEPIVLPPGYGLSLQNVSSTSDIAAAFEWVEEVF